MGKRSICFVTGSRADYGHLLPLLSRFKTDRDFNFQLIVAGSHFSSKLGSTYKQIEKDGFSISKKIKVSLGMSEPRDIARIIGQTTQKMAEALLELRPEFLVVFGDRYEMLSCAQAALVLKIPVVHIGGGDVTEGAFDESIRHSITKMAHLHFVTNKLALNRICQLGENPGSVFNVGSLILDHILSVKFLSRSEVESRLAFKLRSRNILITFHPITLDAMSSTQQLQLLLKDLDGLPPDVGLIFTSPNADTEGLKLLKIIQAYVNRKENACFKLSMGQELYFSTMRLVDAVVGNSSSGIYEAPSFKIPTVNIGDRQKGRIQARSILNVQVQSRNVHKVILSAFSKNCSRVVNPYGDGLAAKRIHKVIKACKKPELLLKKKFWKIKS